MFKLIEKKPKITDAKNTKELVIYNGLVEFKNVGFYYNKENIVLNKLSFTANKGEKIAIVGTSGSGKSTIIKLLFRFFDICSGEILIDKQNIAKVSQHSLRQSIGIVPQDNILFNDTIFNNIAYGTTKNIDLKEVRKVAKLALIDDFIMSLPDNYKSIVGERGLKLSGGEKQRLAIARVLLKNPSIIIFDEATSALDNTTEKKVQQAINNFSKNKTTIIIAHRLSTIKDADKILVLKDGKIIESGKHSDLMQNKNEYYLLNKQQDNILNT